VIESPPVIIIGGGLAGLTAATYLRRHGIRVRLFEASPNLAGLARSTIGEDGFTYDFGAHFITNRLAAAVGCSATCKPLPRYGESIWYQSESFGYPYGLLNHAGFLGSALVGKIRSLFRSPRVESVADWYRQSYGRRLADEVAIPITEAWSGARGDELAVSVADKLSSGMGRTLFLKLAKWYSGRTVAIGYSSTFGETPHVTHVYPEGGIGSVCEHLANEVEDAIEIRTPVEAIHTDGQRVIGVRANGIDYDASAVINTAPVHVLGKIVTGTDKLKPLTRFRYRAMIFVNLRFEGRGLLPDVVMWIPDRNKLFFRLSEIGTGLPWLVPEGKTLITADIGCSVGDANWKANDSELGERCIEQLQELIPDARSRYLGCRVMRTPLAYPIFLREYESDRVQFQQSTGIEGLYSIGRNGEFAHILMEDVYWRTRRKLRPLIDGSLSRGFVKALTRV
jgi:protoporphyrinogen oxidase